MRDRVQHEGPRAKQPDLKEKNMRTAWTDKLTGFLLGGAVGAVIGYLTAPRSGDKTRSLLNEKGKDTVDRVVSRYQDTRNQAEEMVSKVNQELTERTKNLKKVGSKLIDQEREVLDQGVKEAKQAISA